MKRDRLIVYPFSDTMLYSASLHVAGLYLTTLGRTVLRIAKCKLIIYQVSILSNALGYDWHKVEIK